MYRLDGVVREYAWGSLTAIAELRGEPSPSAVPQAELWLGAHPAGPSLVDGRPLDAVLAEAPTRFLGQRVAEEFGEELPFLLKVLAAAQPLSLQAHPTRAQAQAGFEADEAAGIPLHARHRNYRDRNHKPELICALTTFEALCGFRAAIATLELVDSLAVAELSRLVEPLRRQPNADGVRSVFTHLMALEPDEQGALAERVCKACQSTTDRFSRERAWAVRLGEKYPGDIGAVSSLLLNLVSLQPGEALYLPAGNLHAYLGGLGIEIMANSDNVLRGGLTPKHVNVGELLKVLDFTPTDPPFVEGRAAGPAIVYSTPAREFELTRIELEGSWDATASGPEVVLAIHGKLVVTGPEQELMLSPGSAAFVPAGDAYSLSGVGTAFRAAVPA